MRQTRKGFKNFILQRFKTKERGDFDGEREGFKMNKTEMELKTLTDLAFIVQDYETVRDNVEFPI